MTPRFSVVTATKDRPDQLAGCIQSVQAQTFQDLEHVVHDVSGGQHRGLTLDSIDALAKATGEIVVLLHDDDRLPPDALEIVDRKIGAADWLVGTCRFYAADGQVMYDRGGTREAFDRTMAGEGNQLGAAVFWRREFLTAHPLNPTYDGAQDYEQYLRMGRASVPVIVPDVLHHYHDHPECYSNVMRAHQADMVEAAAETWCA